MTRSARLPSAGATALVVLLAAVPLAAQDRAAVREAAPRVAVLRVRPDAQARVLTPGSGSGRPEEGVRPARRPRALLQSEKQTLFRQVAASAGGGGGVNAVGGIAARPIPELEDLTLSARRPWVNEQGYLETLLAYSTDANSGTVEFNKNYPGLAVVRLKVISGRSYLLDFVVDSWGSGTFSVESGDNKQTFPNSSGERHLLVGLQAAGNGWVRVELRRTEGSGFYLHEVQLTRVK